MRCEIINDAFTVADRTAGGRGSRCQGLNRCRGAARFSADGSSILGVRVGSVYPCGSRCMIKLEQLQPNAAVRGIVPDALVAVVSVQWYGSEALELTYKTAAGKVANELLYRHDEPRLDLVEQGRPWGFDGDGSLFRLVSEAQRIRLAHLFDPVLAVHTSVVDPLPHQITAVYESMLPRQPLRFLLADDPGAGKTIMAGLLIKELIARGDLQRCLIVCPGSLAEQWQDELERHRDLLKRGAVLVDERDSGTKPRVLFYIEHAIQDASLTRTGERRVVSKRMLYVELDGDGTTRHMHYAPYLDYRPLAEGEPGVDAILARPECAWIDREIERKAQGYAIAEVVPGHLKEVREGKLKLIGKTEVAVKDRLTKEITYWDHRAEQLKLQEKAGRLNAKLNSGEARKRADNLQGRLQKRLEELKLEAQISPLPPVVLGGLVVVPSGLIAAMTGKATSATFVACRHAGQRRSRARCCDGGRARSRFRAH